MHSLKAQISKKPTEKVHQPAYLKKQRINRFKNMGDIKASEATYDNPPQFLYTKPSRWYNPKDETQGKNDMTIKKILSKMEDGVKEIESEHYLQQKNTNDRKDNKKKTKASLQLKRQIEEEKEPIKVSPNREYFASPQTLNKRISVRKSQNQSFLKKREASLNTSDNYQFIQNILDVTQLGRVEESKGNSRQPNARSQMSGTIQNMKQRKDQSITSLLEEKQIYNAESLSPQRKNMRGSQSMVELSNTLPSIVHYSNSKIDHDKQMFNEIFIQPKQQLLEGVQNRKDQFQLPPIHQFQSNFEFQNKQFDDNIMNELLKERQNLLIKNIQKEYTKKDIKSEIKSEIKKQPIEKETNEKESLEQKMRKSNYKFQNYQAGKEDEDKDLVKLIMKKFNSNSEASSGMQSFFTQQIQVQPPEGLISTIGGSGQNNWAPSVPSHSQQLKANLKDVTLRAKAGIQAGDVQKEAHMAFNLGNMNEEKNMLKVAIKYYKRFFFCARILEDPVGASLALNRLGVVYHKNRSYDKSLQFHIKHRQFSDQENIFAAFYNTGVSYRLINDIDKSIDSFKNALEWAQIRNEYDSQCICHGQLGVTYLLYKEGDEVSSAEHFQHCLELAQNMQSSKLQLECLLCLAYIYDNINDYEASREFFSHSYEVAKFLKEKEIAEQCLCNMGIAAGNLHVKALQNQFKLDVEDDDD